MTPTRPLTRRLVKACAVAAALTLGATAPALADGGTDDSEARTVSTSFSAQEIAVMAKSSGRSEAQQRSHLDSQARQNNAYATLASRGLEFDGAYFDGANRLVVQADEGSDAARAAAAAGLKVREARHGEAELTAAADKVASAIGADATLVSIAPDVAADRVVVTVTDASGTAASAAKKAGGDAVTVVEGAPLRSNAVRGGDKLLLGGGYCSAGFPAHDRAGTSYMVWAGHCLDGIGANAIKTKSGSVAGYSRGTAFRSYDGQPDRDYGVVALRESMSTALNDYGARQLDASRGAWKAPVGTDMCKSGATSGISCGQVTGYDARVTYTDENQRVQAQVSDLGTSTVCTAPGDSGGAMVSGGYAVGMTSGGPKGQSCGFNGGYIEGASSYFQPVNDALAAYGLEYGPGTGYNG